MDMAFASFIVMLIFGFSLLYLLAPFFSHDSHSPQPPLKVRGGGRGSYSIHQDLLCKKEEVLDSLRDYELDHHMKKISDEDYQALYQETLAEGAKILKEIDETNHQ